MPQIKQWPHKLREARERMARYMLPLAHTGILLASLGILILLVYNFGFKIEPNIRISLHRFLYSLSVAMLIAYIIRWLFGEKTAKGKWIELVLMLLLTLSVLFNMFDLATILPSPFRFLSGYFFVHLIMAAICILELSRWSFFLLTRTINPSLLLVFSFLFIILAGTFMLLLPNASHYPLHFTDALFTATSAVCVTGLTVVDTATQYTSLGRLIIVVLIQLGGIGIMTFTTFFAFFFASSSFHSRVVMRELLSTNNLSEIFKILASIVLVTGIIEAIGAFFIYSSIHGTLIGYDAQDEWAFAIFHSISAFCNAGFSTLPGGLYDPQVSTNYVLHTIVALLIIWGGIGFPIVLDYLRLFIYKFKNMLSQLFWNQKHPAHHRMISINTRLAIITTIILLVSGTLLFLLLEYSNSLKEFGLGTKIVVSFFNSVTPRTAGFNNVDLGTLRIPTILMIMFLMWVGASPMSTGGGIKTTTFAIMIMNLASVIRGRSNIECRQRVISNQAATRAQGVIGLSILWLSLAVFLLSITEANATPLQIVFEAISALGTVGLSLNLSPNLSHSGKLIIILTMFVGRVGLISILTSIFANVQPHQYKLPEESVMT